MTDQPSAAEPKTEATVETKVEASKAEETPKAEEKPIETPKAEEKSAEASKLEEKTTESPKAEEKTSEAPKAEEKPAEEKAQASDSADKKKVLIVEDTIELAEVLEATLQRMGIDTKHETHANKALEIFKSYHPNLILLDIGLPDMSGWKLLDSIKEIMQDNRPHFVIITAYGDPANRLMGKLQDVDSYLIKPFSPEEIERVVGKVLGMSKPA